MRDKGEMKVGEQRRTKKRKLEITKLETNMGNNK